MASTTSTGAYFLTVCRIALPGNNTERREGAKTFISPFTFPSHFLLPSSYDPSQTTLFPPKTCTYLIQIRVKPNTLMRIKYFEVLQQQNVILKSLYSKQKTLSVTHYKTTNHTPLHTRTHQIQFAQDLAAVSRRETSSFSVVMVAEATR